MKELVKSFFCHSTLNADELVNLERDHSSENNARPPPPIYFSNTCTKAIQVSEPQTHTSTQGAKPQRQGRVSTFYETSAGFSVYQSTTTCC